MGRRGRRGPVSPGARGTADPRRRLRARRWAVLVGCLAVVLGLAGCSGGGTAVETGAADFYRAPSSVPRQPGVVVRSAPMAADEVPTGARGWRILYTTSADDGVPTVSSGVVLVPASASGPVEHLVAWAHGTTGVADACAPSRMSDGLQEGGLTVADEVIDKGWGLVATDYVGLGTPGMHPYLVGQPAGRSVLDAVRAARQLDQVASGADTVVWGYSEGGGAALWADKLAPSYAPEVPIAGVAAVAPASNLPGIVDDLPVVPTSAVYVAYLLAGYTSTYDDVTYAATLQPDAVMTMQRLAQFCIDDPRATGLVESSGLLDGPVWGQGPESGRLHARLAENVPDGRMTVPVLLLQGGADSLVTPQSQGGYVVEQCRDGSVLDYREYDGVDHVGIVQQGGRAMQELLAWTGARFDGRAARASCAG